MAAGAIYRFEIYMSCRNRLHVMRTMAVGAGCRAAGFITMKVSGTTFFEIVIMILIAAGIFNTLFVSVMERMREFGIMMAIGFSPRRLFRLVMWESLFMAKVGVVVGVAATAFPYYWFAKHGIDRQLRKFFLHG